MDILLQYDNFSADVRVFGNDLAGDDTLYTAVLISLFTDARAESADEMPPEFIEGGTDQRGFWGDDLAPDGESIGSKLWLLRREKQLPRVVARAEQYATESLQWLVRDGFATEATVTASVPVTGVLALRVVITRPNPVPDMPRTEMWNFSFKYEGDSDALG